MAHHRSRHPVPFLRTPVAAACIALAAAPLVAAAQDAARLPTITITGSAPETAAVAGFGDEPLERAPLSARVYAERELRDRGVQRLSDVTRSDAAVSDAYNSVGYWDYLSVRGYTLDQRYNYRRDGLPISAETSIPLDNKARIEILKGTSGIQAGTSAPGGLADFIVKRPTGEVRSVVLGWQGSNSRLAAADIGTRFGAEQAFGVRVNAAYEHLDPKLRDAEGHRRLLAVAADWRLAPDTLLEAEFETSRRSQPSQPGFSALGNTVPAPVDPRINLNNQPWSLPVVMDANTASLRLKQRLAGDWRFTAHAATQRLATDDRLAYPFGCTDANGIDYYADRYCPDGTFDLWEWRSDNEHRRSDALNLGVDGRVALGATQHTLAAGVLFTRYASRFQDQIFDFAGTGNVDGTAVTGVSGGALDPSTNRTDRSTELYLRDTIRFGEAWSAWLGLRHTRLHRESIRTDPADPRATDYRQSVTTPWLAVGYEFAPRHLVYASWGQGIETEVAPNRPRYTNAGQTLPALKSRQVEAGVKAAHDSFDWQLAWFDIVRPQSSSGLGCSGAAGSCTLAFDGEARHRGVEAAAQWHAGAWTLGGGAMWLDAERRGSSNPAIDGQRPPNVPERTLKLQAGYRVAALPGLRLLADVVHEGDRTLLPDGSLRIPAWTRLDLGLVHQHRVDGTTLTWRAGVENATDKRAWRESPYQFEHSYLYPMAPRTWRVSLQADF